MEMRKNVKMAARKEQTVELHLLETQEGSPVKFLTKEEVERFFAAIPKRNLRDRLLFDLIYRYGLRRSEAGLIDRARHLTGDRIWITRLKRGLSGFYPISGRTRRLIWQYLSELQQTSNTHLFPSRQSSSQGISGSAIYYLFRRYARAAGLAEDACHPHTLRHSIAVHFLDTDGLELLDVKDWLAHRHISSTMVYAHISATRRNRSYRRVLNSRQIART
ncbi:MAG: integrase family protein [Acidobacteria bacterium]|nr:integrase family protein [Acidobacteriota bacterium]